MSILQYPGYREWLNITTQAPVARRNRPASLGVLARKLGYRSPRSVAMVLKGQRLPSQQMIHVLSRAYRLSAVEQRYFELSVLMEKSRRSGRGTERIQQELEQLRPRSHQRMNLDLKAFSFVSEWYHLPIKQLAAIPGFREDLVWIRKRLKNRVSLSEIKIALDNMLSLGILRRKSEAGALEVNPTGIGTTSDVPSQAIRSHHKQMMDRAAESLKDVPVDEREFTSLTLRCEPSRVAEAKKMIREFRDEFDRQFGTGSGTEVYQLNVQFFPHTAEQRQC